MNIFTRIIADGLLFPQALIGAFALLVYVAPKNRYQSYARIIMAGLTALLVAKLASVIYQPEVARPFELLHQSAGALYLNNPGFPSDHALFAGSIALAVFFETPKKKLGIFLMLLAIVICIGRVLGLVHTPLDVIGGLIASMIGALWYFVPAAHTRYTKAKA